MIDITLDWSNDFRVFINQSVNYTFSICDKMVALHYFSSEVPLVCIWSHQHLQITRYWHFLIYWSTSKIQIRQHPALNSCKSSSFIKMNHWWKFQFKFIEPVYGIWDIKIDPCLRKGLASMVTSSQNIPLFFEKCL